METYPIKDNNELQFGFEIDKVYIGPKKIAQLLLEVPAVTNIECRRMFDFGNEIHVEFEYLSEKFVVWEPHGDSSRYWICPRNKQPLGEIDISALEWVFKQYRPSFFVKFLGDILSLNFIKRLRPRAQ